MTKDNVKRITYWIALSLTHFVDIDECATTPCQNGGSCTDEINDYTCNCVEGYDGANCENGNSGVSFKICQRY